MTSYHQTKLVLLSLFHGLFGMSATFYFTALNSMEEYVKNFTFHSIKKHYGYQLSDSELQWAWSITSSSLFIGVLIGAISLNSVMDHFGRRDTIMLLKNCAIMIGALLQGLSKPFSSIELLIVGRLMVGVPLMWSEAIHVFMAECSPTNCRGLVSCLPVLGARFWMVAGALLSMQMCGASESTWHFVLMYPIIPSFVQLFFTPLVPKSPKHLFMNENDEAAARKAVRFYHGPEADFRLIKQEYLAELDASKESKSASFIEILTTKHMRWPLVLTVVALLISPFGGSEVAHFYSTGILRSFGISKETAPLYTVFCIQVPGALVAIPAILYVDRVGRRPLFLLGAGLSVFGLLLLTITTPLRGLYEVCGDVVAVLGFALILIGFSGSTSMIGPLLPGEIAPQASRAFSLGAGFVCMMFPSLIILFCYPTVSSMIGSYANAPIALCGALVWIFIFCFLPETKNRSVDQVIETWM